MHFDHLAVHYTRRQVHVRTHLLHLILLTSRCAFHNLSSDRNSGSKGGSPTSRGKRARRRCHVIRLCAFKSHILARSFFKPQLKGQPSLLCAYQSIRGKFSASRFRHVMQVLSLNNALTILATVCAHSYPIALAHSLASPKFDYNILTKWDKYSVGGVFLPTKPR